MRCSLVRLLAVPLFVFVLDCSAAEPAKAKFVGTQPELRLVLLQGNVKSSTVESSVAKIVASAKLFWKPTEDFWPEPAEVIEHDSFWWVKFRNKDRIVVRNGEEMIEKMVPGLLCIRVEKADFQCSFVPVR